MANGSPSAAERTDWAAMVAVFALVIGFTYSDDAVEFLTDVTGGRAAWRWLVVLIDVALVAGTAVLAWHTSGRRPWGAFLRELITGWWALGAASVIAVHLVLLGTASGGHRWSVGNSPWLTLLTTAIFVAAMGMLLVSTLGSSAGSRAWVAPVIVGTFVVQLASALWYPLIDANSGCAGEVSTDYFNGMVQVLPVFLITLGLEVNYLRGRGIRQPGQRAVAVLTVLMLCVAQALTFSILVKAGQTHCGVGAVWHEYIAFVTTVHAAAISLATLAWLLLSSTAEPT